MSKIYKRLIWFALTILGWSLSMNAQGYSGGAGTLATPYEIANKADLKYLCEHSGDWDKHFKQTADIVFKDADFESGRKIHKNKKGFLDQLKREIDANTHFPSHPMLSENSIKLTKHGYAEYISI